MTPLRILVTAGPTHEPIDAVRYLANRSSGRMGLALASTAASRGWATTLLLGPTPLRPPDHSLLTIHRFQTTADLQMLLKQHWPHHDVLIMAAAVADYRVAGWDEGIAPRDQGIEASRHQGDSQPASLDASMPRSLDASLGKIKRGGPMTLQLEPTPDLLAELAGTTRSDQTVIGFALEPHDRLVSSAQNKLVRKRLNAIVANPLETMDSLTVTARVFLPGGKVLTPKPSLVKEQFAEWLLDHLGEIRALARACTK